MTAKKKNVSPLDPSFERELLYSPFLLQTPFLQLSAREGLYNVQLRDILYCSSDNSLTIFHTAMGMRIFVSKSLSHFEQILRTYGFQRAHHKYLVNLTKIICCRNGEEGHQIELVTGEKIPVSRAMKKTIAEALQRISVRQQTDASQSIDLLKIYDADTK